MPSHYALQHGLEPTVLAGEGKIRPDLGRRVTQPHGVDIASDDEGVRHTVLLLKEDSRVECVGEALLEHGGEPRIGDATACFLDDGLNSRAGEAAVRRHRPTCRKLWLCQARERTCGGVQGCSAAC